MIERAKREVLNRSEVGVSEEVSRLKQTLVWGPTGVEAALAVLIPEDKSLFFGRMDVMEARREFEELSRTLEGRGCEVIRVRDLAAEALVKSGGEMPAPDLAELRLRIIAKADLLIREYGRGMGDAIDCVSPILEEDAERYGEEGAIRLNAVLAQIGTGELPMANLLFGRDQSNMVGHNLLWSKMAHPIRRPEVGLWHKATAELLAQIPSIAVRGSGTLEGGDTIVHNGDCLVGVGGRTNLAGVEQIAPLVLDDGFRLYAVYHPDRAEGRLEHQTTMHLDTFYMPGPKNTAVVWMEEAAKRTLLGVTLTPSGGIQFEPQGTFADYLIGSGADIVPLTRDQQLAYQANFGVLDRNTVALTVSGDGYLRGEFEKRGIKVVIGNLNAVTNGYGGLHCSLAPVWRCCD